MIFEKFARKKRRSHAKIQKTGKLCELSLQV